MPCNIIVLVCVTTQNVGHEVAATVRGYADVVLPHGARDVKGVIAYEGLEDKMRPGGGTGQGPGARGQGPAGGRAGASVRRGVHQKSHYMH